MIWESVHRVPSSDLADVAEQDGTTSSLAQAGDERARVDRANGERQDDQRRRNPAQPGVIFFSQNDYLTSAPGMSAPEQ